MRRSYLQKNASPLQGRKTHMESDGDTKQSKNHKSDGFFQLLKKVLVFDLYRYK